MLALLRDAAISALQWRIHRIFSSIAPQLSLAGTPLGNAIESGSWWRPATGDNESLNDSSPLEDALWFAVPKKKVTRGKKRMKTTLQKRIKLKDNIVIDKRTGELTLKHKLPYNWKNYLPENADYAP